MFMPPVEHVRLSLSSDARCQHDLISAWLIKTLGSVAMPAYSHCWTRKETKTPMADYDARCRVISTSKCRMRKSRTSSSPLISRRGNASASRRRSRRSSKNLAKTCKSASHRPVAPRSRIHDLFFLCKGAGVKESLHRHLAKTIAALVRPRLIIQQGLRTPTGPCFGSFCIRGTRGLSFRWPFMKRSRRPTVSFSAAR